MGDPQPAAVKRVLTKTFKLAIGLFLLWAALRNAWWGGLWQALNRIVPAWFVMACSSVIFGLSLKVIRWRELLVVFGIETDWISITRAYLAGQAANIILPFRGGEIIRITDLRLSNDKGTTEIAASIILEKYLDILMLALSGLIAGVLLYASPFSQDIYRFIPVAAVVGSVMLGACVYMAPVIIRFLRRWSEHFPQPIQNWILENSGRMASGFTRLKDVHVWKKIIIQSVLIWAVMALTNWLVFVAMDIPGGIKDALLVLILVMVGMLPAAMPGNIGPFYFFAAVALAPTGLAYDLRLAYAIILHAMVTLTPLLGFAFFFFVDRYTLGQWLARNRR